MTCTKAGRPLEECVEETCTTYEDEEGNESQKCKCTKKGKTDNKDF